MSDKHMQSEMLFFEISGMIEKARETVSLTVNAGITTRYWNIGKKINDEILDNQRGEYGKEILATLSQQLSEQYGKGFNYSNLTRMCLFAHSFPDFEILATLSRHLSWSHFISIIPLKDHIQREYYAEMCRIERWSVRTLRKKIDSMLYERTAISRKPEQMIQEDLKTLREEDKLTPDMVFRDPYFLDFLGLKDAYDEKNLEDAILHELEQFILELGHGFTFVERQKRMKELYRQKGYSDDWIEKRVRGIAVRHELTDEWNARNIDENIEFAILTNEISKATFGKTVEEYKKHKNLTKENLRDHMNDLELIFTMLMEKKSRQKSQEARAQKTSTSAQKRQKKEEKSRRKCEERRRKKNRKNHNIE